MGHKRPDYLKLPFTVLIDSNEGAPWMFKDLPGDAKDGGKLLQVDTKWQSLGRYPRSLGDYSIDGHVGRVAIERKSMADAQGTILGWETDSDNRRERFESELQNLSYVPFSIVIVEATLQDCLLHMPSYGVKSIEDNRKVFWRSVMAYQQDFPTVQWMFCGGVRLAEEYALWWMRRYWRKVVKEASDGETV